MESVDRNMELFIGVDCNFCYMLFYVILNTYTDFKNMNHKILVPKFLKSNNFIFINEHLRVNLFPQNVTNYVNLKRIKSRT